MVFEHPSEEGHKPRQQGKLHSNRGPENIFVFHIRNRRIKGTPHVPFQDFLVILKHLLQNY